MFYIYKIKGINYIGSTNNIKQRYRDHNSNCWNKNSNDHNIFVYKYIREKNMDIELEILFCYKGNCSNKIQRLVEQYYINIFDSKNNGMNTDNAFTSKKNRKKYRKKYYKSYMKIYNKKNKDKRKKYREENKKKIKKYQAEYSKKNSHKYSEKRKVKVNCPNCNSIVSRGNLSAHKRSLKCKSFQVAV